MTGFWLFGLIRHRFNRLAGTALGVAVTVALLASLSIFLAGSIASMSRTAVSAVPIDWQVELVPGAAPEAVRGAIGKAAPVSALHRVFYAGTDGFQATTGATVQTTGPGKVIAFDAGYLADFPKELRPLTGQNSGVLIAQQTAANLHVGPGDSVSIKRIGLSPRTVTVAGIVDLPDADSLFQAVGLPKQAAPQAPPDNVLILPEAQWHDLFDKQQASRPDSVRMQYHVRLSRDSLPPRPTAAFVQVARQERNLESRVAGQALVADNLAARLDAVRGDGLYATVLFLFLGMPGVALAGALTYSTGDTGTGRRIREQALLRLRGATRRRILSFTAGEALSTGGCGAVLGLGAAMVFARYSFPAMPLSEMVSTGPALSAATGIVLAFAAVLLPGWRAARRGTVTQARRRINRAGAPLWQRLWLDVIALAASGLLFWQAASTGYQIVLAPEGVAATSVDYKAFLAPALFWIGAALMTIRIASGVMSPRLPLLARILRPLSGRLAPTIAASLARQRRRIALGIAMTALAMAFATSTAIFNTTYNAQAKVDAELTNGADVTAFGTASQPAGAHLDALAALPGVADAVPMQHRFAYVGNDLQDLYGIGPSRIGKATSMSDSYFRGGTAAEILGRLKSTPDGVLVSEETVADFQLKQGDAINLRLMSAADHQYHQVPFRFIGVAPEFPTAPKDSFLVANSAYVARMTGSGGAEYVLMKSRQDPSALALAARAALAGAPGITVKDIGTASRIIGSSLTAISLSGLTRIELTFAVVMAAGAAGLMLSLGFRERKRDFAILAILGARSRQMRAFLWGEGALVLTGGLILGAVSGIVTAQMMVKLLTGVFDPPPEALVVPWAYLALV
ncbi:MAG: FtsX-like permease family protein, partial [Paracoccaceae bacterium]